MHTTGIYKLLLAVQFSTASLTLLSLNKQTNNNIRMLIWTSTAMTVDIGQYAFVLFAQMILLIREMSSVISFNVRHDILNTYNNCEKC